MIHKLYNSVQIRIKLDDFAGSINIWLASVEINWT